MMGLASSGSGVLIVVNVGCHGVLNVELMRLMMARCRTFPLKVVTEPANPWHCVLACLWWNTNMCRSEEFNVE